MPQPTGSPTPYSAEEVAARGDDLYEKRIRAHIEAEHKGEVVAIDVRSGSFAIDKTALAASERLMAEHPAAEIWCVRVGHRALHHIGSRSVLRLA